MALYRNIAGADRLGLFQQADIIQPVDGLYYGGGGDIVFYDPGTYTLTPAATATVTPAQPLPVPDEPTPVTTPVTPTAQTTDTVTPTADVLPAVQPEVDWLPLITVAGLFFTMFEGERFLKSSRKLAFIGGLGALYYEFARKK